MIRVSSTGPSILSFVVLGLQLLAAAPFARSNSVVVDPGPAPPVPLQHKARITVVVDGKPLSGVMIDISQGYPAEMVARLTSDAHGNIVLPELPSGRYFIGVSSPNLPQVSRGSLPVCIIPCFDDGLEMNVLVAKSLNGEFYAIDRNARALSEFRFEASPRKDLEISPTNDPSWAGFINATEQQPISSYLSEFRGVVQDQSGAVIPDAWIDVRVKGTGGEKHAALLRSDNTGRFDIHLPDGDYVGLISSPGFRTRALQFRISLKSPALELPIVLEVSSVTQTITLR